MITFDNKDIIIIARKQKFFTCNCLQNNKVIKIYRSLTLVRFVFDIRVNSSVNSIRLNFHWIFTFSSPNFEFHSHESFSDGVYFPKILTNLKCIAFRNDLQKSKNISTKPHMPCLLVKKKQDHVPASK